MLRDEREWMMPWQATVTFGIGVAMVVGASTWAADSSPAQQPSTTKPSASAASPSPQVIAGTIAALDLKHPVTPTVTVRRADGRLIKVRVDANLTSVSEGQASSQLGMLSRVRLDQRVTVTATPKQGTLIASLIKINPPPSFPASTSASPAVSSRPAR